MAKGDKKLPTRDVLLRTRGWTEISPGVYVAKESRKETVNSINNTKFKNIEEKIEKLVSSFDDRTQQNTND